MKAPISLICATFLFLNSSLITLVADEIYTQKSMLIYDVAQAIKERNHVRLGELLKDTLGKKVTLGDVEKIAKEQHSAIILRAIQATRALIAKEEAQRRQLGLTRGDFIQMALFIESALPSLVQKNKHYFPMGKTHFSSSIEYDPQTKNIFLLLDGCDSEKTYIGEGAYKVVTKALKYSLTRPEIVARADEKDARKNELQITKMLKGAPGIFDIKACTSHKKGSTEYSSIYSKIYNRGSLRDAFDAHVEFSFYEKERIALSLLQGLHELHKRKIVHRDLSARNYLINIPPGKPGRRAIVAAVADLGRALYSKEAAKTKVQGNTSYTSPEAIFKKKMRGSDYFGSDVYALGLVLYQLFYDKRAKWQDSYYVKNTELSEKIRSKILVKRINKYTSSRRRQLDKKKAQNSLSPSEDFEYLIYQMIEPNPKKRGSIFNHLIQMQRIISRGS